MQKLIEGYTRHSYSGIIEVASSITPLAAAAVDVGEFINCSQFSRLHGTVFADQGGTLNIHFSGDGVNIDYTRTISVGASDKVNSAWDQLVIAPYVKFEYINGSTIQGAYRFYAFGRSMS
jgi:hypothetical protein